MNVYFFKTVISVKHYFLIIPYKQNTCVFFIVESEKATLGSTFCHGCLYLTGVAVIQRF